MMGGCTLVCALVQILVALCIAEPLDYATYRARHDAIDTYKSGEMNDGNWTCPFSIISDTCPDGKFSCACGPDESTVFYIIGCCYKFPSCGVPCEETHTCKRWENCQTCRSIEPGNSMPCNSCKPGFIWDGGLCQTDYNECDFKNGGCEHKCINTYGSYKCDCHDGFKLESDEHTCTRLSCEPPNTIANGTVTATDNIKPWSFASYAKFACNDPTLMLDGPYALRCSAKGTSMFWSENNPACIDSCSYVAKENRLSCAPDDVDPLKCQELGCCYHELDEDAPKCFFDPSKFFLQYGKKKPKQYTAHSSLRERSAESCAHQALNKDGFSLYLIVREGHDDTHNVDLQLCEPISGKVSDYELEDNVSFDLYEYLLSDALGDENRKMVYEKNIPSHQLTAIPTGMFTRYPKLQSFVSPRLVIKVERDVSTPLDNPSCVKNCYNQCNSLTSVEASSNGDVTIRTMHLNLAHLTSLMPPHTRRVYLFAHTVVITANIELTASLYLNTRELIIDRSRASYINLPPGGSTLSTHPSNRAVMDDLISQCVSMEG